MAGEQLVGVSVCPCKAYVRTNKTQALMDRTGNNLISLLLFQQVGEGEFVRDVYIYIYFFFLLRGDT